MSRNNSSENSKDSGSSRSLVRMEGVAKSFEMGEVTVEALRDVTLEVAEKELVVMLGPSGSGKTTILNLVGGLDLPTAGSVWFRDRELSAMTPTELTEYRRRSVGFVFQFYNLVPNLTARENVLVATELVEDPRDVDEALGLVHLGVRTDHFPAQLSGGEQQRVSIARAVAKNPDLLLCDEPTGALDFETGKQVLRVLVDLKEQLGKTVIIITHNGAISKIADRVVRLRSGKVVEVQKNESPTPPEEIVW